MDADKDKRKSAWDSYRIRERFSNPGYLVMLIALLLTLTGYLPELQMKIIFFCGLALTVPQTFWICPACQKFFFWGWTGFKVMNPWRKSCVHCALRKWQDPPPTMEELLKKRLGKSSAPLVLAKPLDGKNGKENG